MSMCLPVLDFAARKWASNGGLPVFHQTIKGVREHLCPRGVKVSAVAPVNGEYAWQASIVKDGMLHSVTATDPHELYIRALKRLPMRSL